MSKFARGVGKRKVTAAGLAISGIVISASVAPVTAHAAVPAFPDNITIFPDRDFVSIDGFSEHAGEQVTIEVQRPHVGLVGSATGTMASATAIAAGNPAIEVNHPGGLCWGAGGGLQVTPDIRAGDVVSVKFGGTVAADATALDVGVTGGALTTPTTLVIQGRLGSEVDPTFLEERIIQPALRDTEVGRRDARAVPGALVNAPKGGYSSGMEVADGTFTATYKFESAETATVAADGLYTVTTWQDQDPDGNTQGVTISEFGEVGGPGMGGCPVGAVQQGPASPTGVVVHDGGGSTSVSWTPPEPVPGTAPILGYTVRAVDRLSRNGVQNEIGVRVNDPDATSVTLPGSVEGKRVEVRSFGEAGESWPPALPGGDPSADSKPPTVTAEPAGGLYTADTQVTLTADEAGAEIYYTLDGSDPLEAGSTGPAAKLYTGPFELKASDGPRTVRFVAFDKAGNASQARLEKYTFGEAAKPGAPRSVTAQDSNASATVRWTAPEDPGTSPITGYEITATPASGAPVTTTTGASTSSVLLTGLKNDTTYTVTVVAVNAVGKGASSTPVEVTPKAPAVDKLAITLAKWKAGDLRLEGTGTVPGASLTLRVGGPNGQVFASNVIVQPPAAGAVNGTWSLRLRTGPGTVTNPSPVHISSDKGGILEKVTLPNG
ncbi:fibronectin type III domain-containing protein [Streptomyces populi]|uniref:fibronectin type III domain-containing protein n=1 Tax=Streptomyces populi TaxID=2058924 RepID=UPI000DD9F5E6|nr:fibronectin type III domain-containing protein [Streptomyces populi]